MVRHPPPQKKGLWGWLALLTAAQKEGNNRLKSVHYQLRAQCESQKVSIVTSKETLISCSQRKNRAENQAQDFIYELQRRLNSQPQQVSSARDWKGKEWGSEAWM